MRQSKIINAIHSIHSIQAIVLAVSINSASINWSPAVASNCTATAPVLCHTSTTILADNASDGSQNADAKSTTHAIDTAPNMAPSNVSTSEAVPSPSSTAETSAASASATGQTNVASSAKVVKDLPNFHEVHPFLYRGGEPTDAGLAKLKSMGVATIIDLRAPTEKALDEKRVASKLGMHYINLVMDSHAPTEKQVQTMFTTIDQAKKKFEAGQKDAAVFLHCAHGSDRTGCMIGIWRVTRDGWDYPTTYKEMRQYYFGPKFTQLSGAVEKYASAKSQAN